MKPIGYVRNDANEPLLPMLIKQKHSVIEVDEEYRRALTGIERWRFIDVVFFLHRNEEVRLTVDAQYAPGVGVFASRCPARPNHIGVTTVELLRVEGCNLTVTGLDAMNASPVLDIKCSDLSFLEMLTQRDGAITVRMEPSAGKVCSPQKGKEDLR
jgi:formylmethanofuran dehydrogenase subunit E